jgi:hypothetical protein
MNRRLALLLWSVDYFILRGSRYKGTRKFCDLRLATELFTFIFPTAPYFLNTTPR